MRTHRYLLALTLVCAQVSWAQARSGAPEQESPQSPRAAMRQFLQYASRGDYAAASQYLSVDARDAPRRAELAQRIYEVIRRRIVIDLDNVSPLAQGDTTDAEPPLQDRVGIMYAGGDTTRPLALVRTTQGGQPRWVISAASVAALDAAYATLTRSWTTGRLPNELLEPGPFGVPRWKWLGAILGVPLAWVLALIFGALLRYIGLAIARRTEATWDDELIGRLRGPVRLFLLSILWIPVLLLLELEANTTAFIWRLLRGITAVSVFWMLLRMIGMAQDHLARNAWASDRTNAQTIVPLIGRSLRLALGLAALLVLFSELGYPVTTLLAGLGIGGIAVALAAQKTVENLFGSVSLAADRVLRVGDAVKFEDVQGTVERIGLRSTHIRTADRTVIKVPNGRLADLRIESFAERDRMRLFTTIRLAYGSTAAQVRTVIRDIEALLTSHPRVWRDETAVRLVTLGAYSFDINVTAWFATTNGAEFEAIRQDVLLGILDIVERAGTRLAVPMQAVQIERDGRASGTSPALQGNGEPAERGEQGPAPRVVEG